MNKRHPLGNSQDAGVLAIAERAERFGLARQAPVPSVKDRWQEHIDQYATQKTFTKEFFDDLADLVRIVALAKKYRASLYAPLGEWDNDAYRTVAVDVLEKQIKNRHLEKLYLARAASSRIYWHFRQAIIWHLGDIAASRGDRLAVYHYVESILKADPLFWYCASRAAWGLASWRTHDWKNADVTLSNHHTETIDVTRLLSTERRQTGAPTEADLVHFIHRFLEVVGHPVTPSQIVSAACAQFGVMDAAQYPWPVKRDQKGDLQLWEVADSSAGAERIAILKELLERFYKELKPRDRILFKEFHLEGRKQKDLSQVGLKHSAVSNHVRQIEARFQELPLERYPTNLVESILAEVIRECEEVSAYGPIANRQSATKAADSDSKAAVRRRQGNRSGDPRATVRGAA